MSSYNFLVVDDSPTMRQLITFALKRIHNSQVTEANDGVDALKKLSGNKFSLILLDINMPLVSGWQCLTEFKKAEHLKKIPVIMFTTSSQPKEKETAKELGADGFLSKPSEYTTLKKLLVSVLSKN